MMGPKKILLIVAVNLLVLLGGGLYWLLGGGTAGGDAAAASSQVGGAFSLTDDQGHPVSEKDLVGGTYHLIFFGFTNCPDVCPGMLSTVAGIYQKLTPEQQARVRMVFVSVDPDRDTREKLHEYVTGFDPSFVGWTGTKAQIDAMTRNYLAYYAIRKEGSGDGAAAPDYKVDHSSLLYLMGPDGGYVTHFRNSDSATSILERLQEILAE